MAVDPVQVYDRLDPDTLLTTLYDASGRSAISTHNEPGSGSCIVDLTNPALADVPPRSLLRFSIDGEPKFQSLVEDIHRVTISQAEEAKEEASLSGRGSLAVWEESVVYPENIYPTLSEARPLNEVRLFNFASSDFDDSGWDTAVIVKQQDAGGDPYGVAPVDWPDPLANWIWVDDDVPQPVGDCYFRAVVVLDEEGPHRVFASADDGFEVFIDGTPVMGETRAFLWGETKYVDVDLSDGEHIVAIKGTNIDRPSNPTTNVAAVILSIIALEDGGQSLGEVVLRTDDAWKVEGFPASPPGFTPGMVMRVLLDEAHSRGELPGVELDFTVDEDSNGDPWPSSPDLAFPVGTSYLAVIEQLTETYIDVAMSRTGLLLRAWGTRGETQAVTLSKGSNLTSLEHHQRA